MLLKNILKKNKNCSGLTLAELVVASVIVGLIMVGIASMDIGVRNMFEGASKNAIVTTRVSILINHIARNLSKAAGDYNDTGVYVGNLSGKTAIWYREDADGDPSNYTRDQWYVYVFNGNPDYDVDYCTSPNAGGGCSIIVQTLGNGSITAFTPTLIDSNATYDFKVSLSITAVFDPSSAVDDIDNPQYNITSDISLPSFGSSI